MYISHIANAIVRSIYWPNNVFILFKSQNAYNHFNAFNRIHQDASHLFLAPRVME